MSFSSTLPRWQLMNKNIVYTFRTYLRKKLGKDWANDGRGKPKLCDIAITYVKKIRHVRQLCDYVEDSGFLTLDAWVAEIKRLNPRLREIRGHLYCVVRL